MVIYKEYLVNNSKVVYQINDSSRFVDVKFYPNALKEEHLVLMADISSVSWDAIQIQDLIERDSYSDGIWGKGYGTLVANTFIELMKYIYFGHNYSDLVIVPRSNRDILVRGTASIVGSSEESFEKRKKFWSRFGFVFEDEAAGVFSAKLSDLTGIEGVATVSNGNDIDLILPINKFWKPINRPLIESYKEALIETDWSELQAVIDRVQEYEPSSLKEIYTKGFWDKIFLYCSAYYFHRKFEEYIEIDKLRYSRSHVREIKKKIIEIEEQYKGFTYRIYEYWSRFSKEVTAPKYAYLADLSKKRYIEKLSDEYEDYIEFMIMTSDYFKQPSSYYSRNESEGKTHNDFLFGEIENNKIYMSGIYHFSQILSKDLKAHINRLLSNIHDCYLVIRSSNSNSAEFGEILKNLPDVHLVELYPSPSHNGGWYLYMKTYHENGIIDFHCDWEVYKNVRVNQLVSNAIYPLFSQKLNSKCYFIENGKKQFLSSNPRAFLDAVFDIVDLEDGICDKETKEIYVEKLQEILDSQKEKALE